MLQVVHILWGAAFTVFVSWSLGAMLLQSLRCRLYQQERRLLAFVVGSGLLSLVVFLLCAIGVAHKGVFLWVGIAVFAAVLWRKPWRAEAERLPALPMFWRIAFLAPFAVYCALYLSNAMAPEISPDGVTYHLGIVSRYLRGHGFHFYTTNMYANLSHGMEMLFLFAFAFGRHSAAAMVHCAFLIALPRLILSYARRAGFVAAGVCGAMLAFLSPVAGIDGVSAYNDVALAAVAFTLFYLLQIWMEGQPYGLLIPIGLMAGFCYAIKYTGFLAVPYAMAVVWWKHRRFRAPVIVAIFAAVMIVPWVAKNWIWLGNPVSPFFNSVFPNPYIHISFEKDYAAYYRNYDLPSLWQVPWLVTVTGLLGGQLGPIFLLAPLGLIALRFPAGRHLWLAALAFGLPYFGNIGARFLIPVLPFIGLAMGIAFGYWPALAIAALLVHSVLSWPRMIRYYKAPGGSWQIETMPTRAALRIFPEEKFLNERLPHYGTARMIERLTPPGARVFSFSPVAEAYTSRDILVYYESADGEMYQDILLIPLVNDRQPVGHLEFPFPRQPLRAVRVVQTASAPKSADMWSVTEFRVFDGPRELPRDARWRLRANPYPWGVQLAFDNSPVTRWVSWQSLFAGMFMEVDFGRVEQVDRVLLESSRDQYRTQLRLEGRNAAGSWKALAPAPRETEGIPPLRLRAGAAQELKLRGIGYLLIEDSFQYANDFRFNRPLWGLTELGEWNGARLYRID